MLQCCLEMVDFMLARNTCHRQLPEQYTSYFLLAKHLVTFILVTIIALLWFARFKSTGKMVIKFIAVHYDDYIQGSSDGVLSDVFARCLYSCTLCWLCLVEHMKVITSVCHMHGIFGSLCSHALWVCSSAFLSSDCIWPAQSLFFPLIGSCL